MLLLEMVSGLVVTEQHKARPCPPLLPRNSRLLYTDADGAAADALAALAAPHPPRHPILPPLILNAACRASAPVAEANG